MKFPTTKKLDPGLTALTPRCPFCKSSDIYFIEYVTKIVSILKVNSHDGMIAVDDDMEFIPLPEEGLEKLSPYSPYVCRGCLSAFDRLEKIDPVVQQQGGKK